MPYNPDLHHRRSIRLQGYDYASDGAYFVTICTVQKQCLFGDVIDGDMRLNAWGEIVRDEWERTPIIRPNVELGAYVIMPNHMHMIVVFSESHSTQDGNTNAVSTSRQTPTNANTTPIIPHTPTNVDAVGATRRVAPTSKTLQSGSLGAVIGQFKSAVTKRINELRDAHGEPLWQRNYYEHILRDEDEYLGVCAYIDQNPARWADDEEYVPLSEH